jgi:hypothetical protein
MINNCKKHELIFVQRFKSNGYPLLNKQCLNCGEKDSKAYKIDKNNFHLLPKFDEDLLNCFYANQRNEYIEKIEIEKNVWFSNYSIYLNSEKWKNKRILVLKRDKFICKACENRTATEVHHLTYKHLFNEPLFDLVSICNACHIFITKLDRNGKN